MEKFLKVGEVLKPQGIKGEVKLKTYVDDVNRFKKLKEAYIDGNPVKVLNARIAGQDVYIAFDGICDRNAAELLRGKEIFVSRENAAPLKEGRYYIADVIGSAVVLVEDGCDTEVTAGVIEDILKYSSDLYCCADGNKKYMFPLVDGLLIKVDIENKKAYFNKKRFDEVVCYED